MNPFELGILLIFHPSDAFDEIKLKNDRLSPLPGLVLLFLLFVVRYLYVLTVHAPLADIKISDTNVIMEIGRIFLPVLTLSLSIYAVQSILYGETTLSMIFTTVTYSLIPYLILTPAMILVSQILSSQEAGYYAAINNAMWLWIILLIISSIMYMNNFSFKKTVMVSLLSIAGVAFIWGVAIMIIAMTIQLAGFFNELYREYILYNL